MDRTKKIEVQGHRGARGLWPENSMYGFLKTIDLGVDVLEMDVVMTGDGNVLVSHDPYFNAEISLDPTGKEIDDEKQYNLYTMSYAEIAQFDCGSKPHPRFPNQQKVKIHKPLLKNVLSEVLQKAPTMRFNIEIKSQHNWLGVYQPSTIAAYVEPVVEVLSKLPKTHYNLQSFDRNVLYYLADHHSDIKLVYLIENQDLNVKSAKELGIKLYAISPDFNLLTHDLVTSYQDQGLKVIPWTVNDKKDMEQLKTWGVDGIISDYPDRLKHVLAHQ